VSLRAGRCAGGGLARARVAHTWRPCVQPVLSRRDGQPLPPLTGRAQRSQVAPRATAAAPATVAGAAAAAAAARPAAAAEARRPGPAAVCHPRL
jgi:hypothetical protein